MLMSAVLAPEQPHWEEETLSHQQFHGCTGSGSSIPLTGCEQQADGGSRDLPNGHNRVPGGKNLRGKSSYSMKKYGRTVYMSNEYRKAVKRVSLEHLRVINSALLLLRSV